jgi:hypothetical protein
MRTLIKKEIKTIFLNKEAEAAVFCKMLGCG